MSKRLELRRGAAPLALVTAATALALAGCTPTPAQNSAAGGTSAPASSSAAPAVPVTAPGQGTPPTAQAPQANAECTTGNLTVRLGVALPSGAPGVTQRPIIFTNAGAAACFVIGWPGVAALNAGGTQIFQAARVNAKGPQVMLQPGQSASAMLDATTFHNAPNATAAPCQNVPNLLVTPPDETHSIHVAFGSAICFTPSITTLARGINGGDTTQAASQFSEARRLWVAGASAISADQGSYWTQAATLLTNAVNSGASGTAGFAEAAQNLTNLTALPDAMLTPAQQTERVNYLGALNIFFSSPGLYS